MIPVLTGIVGSLLGLLLINRYLFSWVGVLLRLTPGRFFVRKSISVPTQNGGAKILSSFVDIGKLPREMRTRPNYYLIDFGYRLTVYRKFGRVWYWISLYSYHWKDPQGTTELTVGIGTPLQKFREGERDVKGESCWCPSGWIKWRIFRLVDDLRLTPAQATEIKKNVRVQFEGDGSLFSLIVG